MNTYCVHFAKVNRMKCAMKTSPSHSALADSLLTVELSVKNMCICISGYQLPKPACAGVLDRNTWAPGP